ncbi:HNH endonuclease [Corchorus capsularis]|uniref:HNH endonuclease n=1 Tax=Corchorus capsularis TaxID=210143 RepID=A0A1R3HI64_COCAP|nr:HNH endonuclease [Corchorus capsularis]
MIIESKDSKSKSKGRSRSRPSSPPRSRSSKLTPPSATLVDGEVVTEPEGSSAITSLFENLQISQQDSSSSNPRIFPYNVKQQCWEKAEKVKGRDPDRWRRDAVGNIVFRKLVGCPGCLCHDYDHILPYSKGGKSTLENCQVLQATVNRSKGNRTELSKADLIQKSSYCRVSGRDMDLIELSAYGNVRHADDNAGGCRIQ